MRRGAAVVPLGLAAVLLGGCFDGCGRDEGPAVVSPQAGAEPLLGPPAMSVGTLRTLGSHVWEASFELRGDRGGIWPSQEVVTELVWSELDFWELRELSNGSLRVERQVDRDLFRKQGDGGRWIRSRAPGGNAMILHKTLELWSRATSGFQPQLAWRELGEDVLDDRPVRVLRVELAPLLAPDGPVSVNPTVAGDRMGLTTTPLTLTGTVYVDIETGSRLLAEVEGSFVPRAVAGGRDPTDEVHVTYREKRTLTSLPPTIEAPPNELVVVPQLRPRGPNARPRSGR